MPTKATATTIATDEVWVLLTLWALGGGQSGGKVGRGALPDSIKGAKGKPGKYGKSFKALEESGAIVITQEKKRYDKISVTSAGEKMLLQGIVHPDFKFGAVISGKTANALLSLLRSGSANHAESNGHGGASAIASYDQFKQVALETYDRLNRDYNLDDLVPIYRIRREIGDQMKRSQFDEWILEMQTKDIWQLIGGEMPELTPDKAEDSIKTALGGVRYYAKRL